MDVANTEQTRGGRARWPWLALGAAAAAAIAWLAWTRYDAWWAEQVAAKTTVPTFAGRPPAPVATAAPTELWPAAAAPACPAQPLLAAAGEGDGRFQAQPAGNARSPSARAYQVVAREVAQQGRRRDAEVALIAACRAALRMGSATMRLADIQSELGLHYVRSLAQIAASEQQAALDRARTMFDASVATYMVAAGPHASKTRLATQRLAALRSGAAVDLSVDELPAEEDVPLPDIGVALDEDAQASPAQPQPPLAVQQPQPRMWEAAPRMQEPPQARRPDEELQARQAQERQARAATQELHASRAPAAATGQAAEARTGAGWRELVRSDPALAQLEKDLARLRQQASAVSEDPAGFQQRAAAAQARREGCRDKACLENWYAQRRAELFREF